MGSRHVRRLWKDTWLLEILSIGLSLVSFGIVIFLLKHFDHKPVFTWLHASLNTWVSVFSTIAKTLLLFTVSAGLSQWTFVWFSGRERKLVDFATFDSASRGPNGSFNLLWNIHIRSFASVGAIVIILSVAIDPFVQSVVDLEERQALPSDKSTFISRAVRYSKGTKATIQANSETQSGNDFEFIKSTADFSMQSAILFGLSNTPASISQQTSARCSGSHCEWGPYLALSVCSTCSDVSDQLVQTTKDYDTPPYYTPQAIDFDGTNGATEGLQGTITSLGLPNGLHLDIEGGTPEYSISLVSYSTSNRSETVTFKENNLLLWSTTVIKNETASSNQVPGSTSVTAIECGLMYCVKNYTAKAINGTLTEISQDLQLKMSDDAWQPSNTSLPDPSPGQLNSQFDYPRSDLQLSDTFSISQVAMNGIATALTNILIQPTQSITNGSGATGFYMSGHQGFSDQFSPDSMQVMQQSRDLNQTFAGLAQSMTNSIRANDDNATVVLGTASIIVYKVRWQWLALPCISLFGGYVFFALTMLQTSRHSAPVWKSSPLPILKIGQQAGMLLSEERSIAGMEHDARKVRFSLDGHEGDTLDEPRPRQRRYKKLATDTKSPYITTTEVTSNPSRTRGEVNGLRH